MSQLARCEIAKTCVHSLEKLNYGETAAVQVPLQIFYLCSSGRDLDARVVHGKVVLLVENLVVSSPFRARVRMLFVGVRFLHQRLDLLLSLYKLQRETTAYVPARLLVNDESEFNVGYESRLTRQCGNA